MKTNKILFFKLLISAGLLLLSGCAQLVTKNYSSYRGGTVKYSTAWFMGDKNREKAVEEMNKYCGSARPSILSEDTRLESTGKVYTNGTNSNKYFSSTSTEAMEPNIYIHFKCVKSSKMARG